MTLKKEDATRRKIFKKLSFTEGSPVTRGGNQHAQVLLVRTMVGEDDVTEETQVPEKTWLQRIADVFRMEEPSLPLSTSEILGNRATLKRLHEVESAFYSALHGILRGSRGRDQVKLLKRSVEEFGKELEGSFPKEAKAAVDRMQADEDMKKKKENPALASKKKKGKTPPQFLSKAGAKKGPATSKAKDGDTEDEEENIAKEVKKAVKRCADIGLIALTVEELSDGDIENIERCIPETYTIGRSADLGGEMKLAEAMALVPDTAREAIERAMEEAKQPTPEATPTEEIVRSLPVEAQEVFRAQATQLDSLKVSNAALIERMDAKDAEQETARIVRIAKELEGIGGKTEAELAETIRNAGEAEDVVVEALRSAKAIRDTAQDSLLGEFGSSGSAAPVAGSAGEKVSRLLEEMKASNPEATETALMSRLWTENPTLSEAVEKEERAAFER